MDTSSLLKPIQNSTKILVCQVNSLLDRSLIRNKQFKPIIQEFELSTAVQDVIEMVEMQTEIQKNKVVLSLSEEIPMIVYTDFDRLQ